MAAVYVNNLVINSGTDFSQSFTLEDPTSNSAFNLTQYSISSQMRKWAGSSTAIIFTSTIEIAIQGKINISLTNQQTTSLKPGRYVYDIIITDNQNKKNKVVEGMVLVREGVTR
jgi:LEA14-like dessication related protein